MGNKQTEKFEWEKKFAILQKNFNDNTLVLQKFQGGHECIGRQIVSTDTKQSQEIKRLIKLKYNKNNPFLTKLMQIYYNNNEGYCSPEDKIFLVFQKPKQTLRQQILARKFANQPFTEQEADIILQSGCKAIRSLKQLSHPHNNVSTSSIFIDQDRRIVLGDPWITPPIYSQDINQNVFACPSPQKILLQNDQILSICPYKSDLFSLGTVVLQVLNFQHMDILYEKGFRRLIQSKVQEKLQKIKNQQLKYKLSAVLSHDPNNRDQIFRFYRTTGFSASSVKNKVFNAYNISQTQQNRKQQVKQVQLNRKKQTKTLIQPKATSNAQKPIHTYNTNTNPNLKISSMPHSYYTNTQTVSQQPNYINSKTNISNNKLSFNPPSMIPSYKPSTTLAQTSHQASTFQNNITNNINRPNFQTSSNNLQTKNNSIPINNYHKNGFTNYNPGAINQTFNTNHQNHFNSGVLSSGGNLVVNYIPQFKVGNANDDERNTTVIPNTFIRIQKKEAISQNNGHVFQATIIKSSQQFVKTSGNIRYMQNLSKSQDSILKQQIENIQHVGNYGVKTEIGVIKPPLLTENTQVKISKQPTNQISVKGKIDPFNSNKAQIKPQEKKLANQAKQTPERRPNNRKYNSTIKQDPDECSYSGSRDGDEEYQCVIQQYETGKYEGQKKNGMRNGFGKFIYNEGSVYQGNWKDNLMHGKGNLYYSDGKLAYEGDWRMDQFHGFGKVYNEDQLPIKGSYDYTDFSNVNDFWASYEGELNSDRRHGKGKIKFSNGQIFSGNFVADIVQGEGKFYSLSGQIIHGIWKNNKLLKKF